MRTAYTGVLYNDNAGAIRGVKKNQLPDDIKADLKDFYQLKKK